MELSVNTPMFSLEDDTNTVYDRTPLMTTIGARITDFNNRMEYRNLETRMVVSPDEDQEKLPGDFVAIEFEQFPTENESFAIRQELIMSGLYMRAHLDEGQASLEQVKAIVGMLEVHWGPMYDAAIAVIDLIQSGKVNPITVRKSDELGDHEQTVFMSSYGVPRTMQDMVIDEIGLPLRTKLNEALRSDGLPFVMVYSRTVGEAVYVFYQEDNPDAISLLDVDDYIDLIARSEVDPAMLAEADKLTMRTRLLNDIIAKYVSNLNDIATNTKGDLNSPLVRMLHDELTSNEFTAAAEKLLAISGTEQLIRNASAHHLFVQLTLADLTNDKSVIA